MKYVNFSFLPNKNLRITLLPEGQTELLQDQDDEQVVELVEEEVNVHEHGGLGIAIILSSILASIRVRNT